MKIIENLIRLIRRLFGKESSEQTASPVASSPTLASCEEAKPEQAPVSQPEQQSAAEASTVDAAAPEKAATSGNSKSDNDTIPQAQKNLFHQIAAYFKELFKAGKQKEIKISVVDGPCNFADILTWFTSQKLDPEKHTPFIMRITPETAKMLSIPDLTKPVGIMLGVYNKSDDMITYQAIQCDTLDQQTADVLGNEKVVVLS